MIGTLPDLPDSLRISRVAATPSMRGILMSIRIRSNRPVRAASTASTPSTADSEVQSNISQRVSATMRLVALSSTTRMWAARPEPVSSVSAWASTARGASNAKTRVSPPPRLASVWTSPFKSERMRRPRAKPRAVSRP